MKKVRILMEETLKYQRSIVIEVPDATLDVEIESLCREIERKADVASDASRILTRLGAKVVRHPDENYDSPDSSDVEVDEYDVEE